MLASTDVAISGPQKMCSHEYKDVTCRKVLVQSGFPSNDLILM